SEQLSQHPVSARNAKTEFRVVDEVTSARTSGMNDGIGPAVVMMSALCVAAANVAASSWAVDPSLPGSNRAAVGSSLFDEITADGVPFPYEALVRKIERATGCAPRRCTTSVLIPLGRSLQRTTASPEFFRYPRVVTAVTAEGATALFAKDRL